MIILTIAQPWAGAIADGKVDVLNMPYATRRRGPLLIHVGKPLTSGGGRRFPESAPPGVGYMQHRFVSGYLHDAHRGQVLGFVEIASVTAGDECQLPYASGDPDAFCWLLEKPMRFLRPVDMREYFFPAVAWREPGQYPELAGAVKTAVPTDKWTPPDPDRPDPETVYPARPSGSYRGD